MIPFAHIGGMPVEELLPTLVGPGAGLLVVRAWLAVSLRRRQNRDR
jgi:hypothetical protein